MLSRTRHFVMSNARSGGGTCFCVPLRARSFITPVTPVHLQKIPIAKLKPMPPSPEKGKGIHGTGLKKIKNADAEAEGGYQAKYRDPWSGKERKKKSASVVDAAARQRASIANVGFDFKKMGIGGLSSSLVPMFRRVFASRLAPTQVVKKMGVRHTKGAYQK